MPARAPSQLIGGIGFVQCCGGHRRDRGRAQRKLGRQYVQLPIQGCCGRTKRYLPEPALLGDSWPGLLQGKHWAMRRAAPRAAGDQQRADQHFKQTRQGCFAHWFDRPGVIILKQQGSGVERRLASP
jgi:hypothetical protein